MNLKYDWNLNDLYKSEAEAEKDFEEIKAKKRELINFKGKLSTSDAIFDCFEKEKQIGEKEEKLACYVMLRKSLFGKDKFARKMEAEMDVFSTEISPLLAFMDEELAKNDDKFLQSLLKEKRFKDYNLAIKDIIRNKKHILSEQIEAVLSKNPSFGMAEEVFDCFNDIDLKMGYVNTPEGRVKLTHGSYNALITNGDQKVRKSAYNACHKAFKNFNWTLGTLYLNDAKETLFFTKIHNFDSVLSSSCFHDKTDEKVLTTLIDVIHDHLPLFYAYEELKKKALKLKDYFYFDNYVSLGKQPKNFDYEKGADIVLEALSVMGSDYVSKLKKAMEGGWIDVYEKEAKTSGGFCLSVYNYHPYVLLNYQKNYNSVSTLAHELGHAMHGVYTEISQPITKASPSIFACEVASIVNEIILCLYMLKKAKNKQEKLFYIDQLLQSFYTTAFRQTMFSEFEYYVYSNLEKGQPLYIESLNTKYEGLQDLYFGKGAKKTAYSKYEWSRIPHFYSSYYVYKYATGFISAVTIARKILSGEKGYREKYIEFLKAGSSFDPLTLLKSVDVDLTRKETMEGAFKIYKELLDQLKELI